MPEHESEGKLQRENSTSSGSPVIKSGDVAFEITEPQCCFRKKKTVQRYTWTLRENGILTQVIHSGIYKKDSKQLYNMKAWFATIPTVTDTQTPETRALVLTSPDGKESLLFVAPTEAERDDWLMRFQAVNFKPLPETLLEKSVEVVLSEKVTKYIDTVIQSAVAENHADPSKHNQEKK